MSVFTNIVRVASAFYLLSPDNEKLTIPANSEKGRELIREEIDKIVDNRLEIETTQRDILDSDWSDTMSAYLDVYIGAKKKNKLKLLWEYLGTSGGNLFNYDSSAAFILTIKNKSEIAVNIAYTDVIWKIKGFTPEYIPYSFSQYKIQPKKTYSLRLEGYNTKTNLNPFMNRAIEDNILGTLISLGENGTLQSTADVTFAVNTGTGEFILKTLKNIDCTITYSGEVDYKGSEKLTNEQQLLKLGIDAERTYFNEGNTSIQNPFKSYNIYED